MRFKPMTNYQIAGEDAAEVRAFLRAHEICTVGFGEDSRGCNADIIGIDRDGDLATTSPITGAGRYADGTIHVCTASGSEYVLHEKDELTNKYDIEVSYFALVPNKLINGRAGTFNRNEVASNPIFQSKQEDIRQRIINTYSYSEYARVDLPVNTWAIAYRCAKRPLDLPDWLYKVCAVTGSNMRVIRGVTAIERLTSRTLAIYCGDSICFYGYTENFDMMERGASSKAYHDEYETVRAEVRR